MSSLRDRALQARDRKLERVEQLRRQALGQLPLMAARHACRVLSIPPGDRRNVTAEVIEEPKDEHVRGVCKVTIPGAEETFTAIIRDWQYQWNEKSQKIESVACKAYVSLMLDDQCEGCNAPTPRSLEVKDLDSLGDALGGAGECLCEKCRTEQQSEPAA